jgi:hypothetical protein
MPKVTQAGPNAWPIPCFNLDIRAPFDDIYHPNTN